MTLKHRLQKIVSGGQTGADRGALDFAREAGFEYGGWVPKGRLDECGMIPEHYRELRESDSSEWSVRTRWNVRDSDATVVLSHGPLERGSKLSAEVAMELGKPLLHLDLASISDTSASEQLRDWLRTHHVVTLNVAGPRQSEDPAIYAATRELLARALRASAREPDQ